MTPSSMYVILVLMKIKEYDLFSFSLFALFCIIWKYKIRWKEKNKVKYGEKKSIWFNLLLLTPHNTVLSNYLNIYKTKWW